MKRFIKSKTNQATVFAMIQSLPTLADPIWFTISDAGVSDQHIAWAKISVIVATAVYGLWGRAKAKGPLL
jgi:hypothetical protein